LIPDICRYGLETIKEDRVQEDQANEAAWIDEGDASLQLCLDQKD
jgi:hypothetical protein